MTIRNKYAKRSRISEKKFRKLVKLFSLDLDAVQISDLSHLNRNTVNRYLMAMRMRIAEFCELESPISGEVEIDDPPAGGLEPNVSKASAAGEPVEKRLSLESSKGMVKYIPKLSQMLDGKHFRILYGVE